MATFESEMARHRKRRKKGKTLASKVGVSQGALSAKIRKVRHDEPGLTGRQAAGKAAGILEYKKNRKHSKKLMARGSD